MGACNLILLRGNSGSGKTSVAKALQKRFGHGTLLLGQDVIRRETLYVKDGMDCPAGQLLYEMAMFGKRNCDIIIMEGILYSKWYHGLFEGLKREFGDRIVAYYFDIPFQETLRRHKTKPNAMDFGEEEMRRWWREKDLLGIIPETLIGPEMSLPEIVEFIYENTASGRCGAI